MVPVNCEEFQKNVHPLLDGELSDEMADAMRAHMAACADCRGEYEQLASVRDMLAHMDDDLETPVEFERGWRKAVREEQYAPHARLGKDAFGRGGGLCTAGGCDGDKPHERQYGKYDRTAYGGD